VFKAERDGGKAFAPLRMAVLAVSDTRTIETDTAGALLKDLMEADGHQCAARAVVSDDIDAIRTQVLKWVADPGIEVIITTGGTGFSNRDVTPEALEPLFHKRIDGFSVLFHQYSSSTVGTSTMQSRATGGLIGDTFVFAVPGSRGACRDAWEGVLRAQLDIRLLPCNFAERVPRLRQH
jgi:molybdenum cofactor biosynthesis protein B